MYNYKYNGKELQETGMYDYGARFYMPDIGRWGVIDPRSQYTHEAYSYVWNNPIRYVDPTGMEGEDPDPKKVYGPKGGKPIEEVKIIPIYRSVPLQPRGIDYSTTGILGGIAMTGGRTPNPYALAAAGIAAIILWNTPKLYQATEAWRKDEMTIDLSPKALPANFAQGQDEADEDTDENGVKVPDDGRTSDDPLRKSKHGHAEEDPEAEGTHHTQLGKRDGRKGTYRQGREFKNGEPEWDYDITDHRRPQNHPNPHKHKWEPNSTGGSKARGKKAFPIN